MKTLYITLLVLTILSYIMKACDFDILNIIMSI